MKNFFLLAVSIIFSMPLLAQHHIEFDIQNYDQDTVVIGHYMIDKQLVHDTLYKNENGGFLMQGEENLQSGVYMLLTVPKREFIQFIVSEKEQNYSLSFDATDLSQLSFENAPDNEQLNAYVSFLKEVRPAADILRDTIKKLRESDKDITEFQEKLNDIDKKVNDYQNKVFTENPDYISSQMLRANKEIIVPDFADEKDASTKRYLYYKEHYFDNIELGNPEILRTPFLHQKIDYYLTKLTPNHPDSLVIALDRILEKMEPAKETYKYYLSHYLNLYAASKVVGYDAIYVHLVDKYYAQGKTPWVEEDNLLKIVDRANKIRPTLIGKIGADLTVYGEDNSEITISELDYEYLILMFWAPDCGHCKKSMPAFVEFNDKWAEKGVKTLAICTKHQDKTASCWESIEEKNMSGFINAVDQYHRSKFKVKYNVTTTPKVFVLDKNREIIIKNIASEQLDEVMEEIVKMKKAEDAVKE